MQLTQSDVSVSGLIATVIFSTTEVAVVVLSTGQGVSPAARTACPLCLSNDLSYHSVANPDADQPLDRDKNGLVRGAPARVLTGQQAHLPKLVDGEGDRGISVHPDHRHFVVWLPEPGVRMNLNVHQDTSAFRLRARFTALLRVSTASACATRRYSMRA